MAKIFATIFIVIFLIILIFLYVYDFIKFKKGLGNGCFFALMTFIAILFALIASIVTLLN